MRGLRQAISVEEPKKFVKREEIKAMNKLAGVDNEARALRGPCSECGTSTILLPLDSKAGGGMCWTCSRPHVAKLVKGPAR